MIDEQKTFRFVGVVWTAFIPYDVKIDITAIDMNQAKIKMFSKLKVKFPKIPRMILVKKINQLKKFEVKDNAQG